MAKRQEEPEPEENLERYMLTYSDLITLLLLFFIIMYSISSINTGRYNELAAATAAQFNRGILEGGAIPKSVLPLMPKPTDMRKYKRAMNINPERNCYSR